MRTLLLIASLLLPAAPSAFEVPPFNTPPGLQFVLPKWPTAGDTVSVYVLAFPGQRGIEVRQWSVERQGSTIRVLVETEDSGTDAVNIRAMRVDVPSLPAGSFQLEWVGIPAATDSDFRIEVANVARENVRPAEGFWHSPGRPGTGLYVQLRGSTIGMALLDQTPFLEVGAWSVGAGLLDRNSAYVPLYASSGGSCFDCPEHHASDNMMNSAVVVDFESARRARIKMLAGGERPIVSLPYGAAYVPVTLRDTHDEEFGLLPLPDLEGDWAFPAQAGDFGVQIGSATVAGETAEFRVTSQAQTLVLRCASATLEREAGCALLDDSSGATPIELAYAKLGNVTETSLQFTRAGGASYRVVKYLD